MKIFFTILIALLNLAGPLAADGPRLLVRGARGEVAPLNIAEVAIEVTIIGDVAETTILVGFRNETPLQLEGDFVMPLPEGATVSSYALDVHGQMRPGVAVEKERARVAYESIKRQLVDPGFVEREAGNVYRTKIFPITPNAVKRVQLGYVEHLKTVDGKLRYELPCQFEVPIAKFSVNIRGTGGTKFQIQDNLGLTFTETVSGILSAKAKNKTIKGTLTFTARQPKLPSLLVESAGEDQDRFFYLTAHAPNDTPVPARPTPKSVLLIWDSSESRQLHVDELATLDTWFQQIRNTKVRLQVLRNKVAEGGVFTVRDGNWELLRTALQDIYYDGTTALDQLRLDAVQEDIVVLCSDGISPFGLPSGAPSKPLFILNDSGAPTPRPWSALAERSGGADLNLGSFTPAQASRTLTNSGLRIVSVTGGGTHSCHFDPDVTPGQKVSISGRLRSEASGLFKVHYGYGSTILTTRSFTINSGQATDGGIVIRLWAQAALSTLESVPEPNRDHIITHCRTFGLVSDFTSLIVLDRFEDHVRYEIPPPEAELLVRYNSALAKKKAKVTFKRGFNFLQYRWDEKRAWHQREFPWMEIALLPRLEQVTIWTRAVSTVFRPEDLDQHALKAINDWRKAATKVVQRKAGVANAADLAAWEKEIGSFVESGRTLQATPIAPPKEGKPLVVSVRGLVNQPGNVTDKAGLTLKQAIAKAGGIFTLGSETNVELYRTAGKTVYNMASNQFQDVPLMPGDMIVVGQSNEPYDDSGNVDPFASDSGNREAWDPSKEPAVLGDSDVWISSGDNDPFAGGGPGSPTFLSNLTGGAGSDLELTATIQVQGPESDTPPAIKAFEAALRNKINPQAAYKALRRRGSQPPDFYVNTARLLAEHGHHQLAVQALSNFLETPELDLGRVLANVMWLTEFGCVNEALALLRYTRDTMPDEILPSYHRAIIDIGRNDDHTLAADLLHIIEMGRNHQGTIALTDFNGLVARDQLTYPNSLPIRLRDNFDSDIRIVVTGSDPNRSPRLTVREPSGSTCRYYTSACGGRVDHAAGVSEYMVRRAMPGSYTVQCWSAKPTTVRATLYRNWGRPHQTSKTVTMLLPGDDKTTTLADYDFSFEE